MDQLLQAQVSCSPCINSISNVYVLAGSGLRLKALKGEIYLLMKALLQELALTIITIVSHYCPKVK